MAENRVLEMRVRRKAARLSWRVEKSRTKNLHCNDYGGFQLINDHNIVVDGDRYDGKLTDFEEALDKERARLS